MCEESSDADLDFEHEKIDFDYKNIDFNPMDFYENRVLAREKKFCLFCSRRARKIICNNQKTSVYTFVSIRHCDSEVCRALAIETYKESLACVTMPVAQDFI